MKKRGQGGSGAATLVAIIGLLMVLYILFLPPNERLRILEGNNAVLPSGPNLQEGGVIPISPKGIIFEESPGKIDYTALSEYEHPLPPFTLFKTKNAQVIEDINSFYIKNGWFDKKNYNTSFIIDDDLRNLENVMLSFSLDKHEGVLSIMLNDILIYEFNEQSNNPKPIAIRKEYLKKENVLEFTVSDVGMSFWNTNEYSFKDVKITADIIDRSREKSTNTFYITETEGNNIERALFHFVPDCDLASAGVLTISMNDRLVYQGIPDCGQVNEIELGPDVLNIGKNKVEFVTDLGSYLVDRISLKTELKSTATPVYYFELDSKLFTQFEELPEEECGKIDGVCPSFCDEDVDIDCCYLEYDTAYWCDILTSNKDDRCVGFVEASTCGRCLSGYEDERGDPADSCENQCGDDTDGKCPAGCTEDLDQDCCFDKTGDQYWCNDLTTNGLSATCVNEVSRGMCDICPTGYDAESGGLTCEPLQQTFVSEELRPDTSVLLTIKFTDDNERKEADIYINGYLTHLQTKGSIWQKDISVWVEPGTNSIEVKPFSTLNIRTLQVALA